MEILILASLFGIITLFILIIYERRKKDKNVVDKIDKSREIIERKLNVKNNQNLIDYSQYHMSIKEYIINFSMAASILFIIGYIFYHNYLISILLALMAVYYPKLKKREIIKKRKQKLLIQFKQALYSLSTALVAGRSVENAFKEVINDLKLLYPNHNTFIIKEFEIINRRVENGEPIEKALLDFSNRAYSEDVTNFTNVFVTCKRTGGDLVEVIRKTANIIGDKIEIQQEIDVLIAQKRFEAQILSISPFFMVAIISYSSPDYMEPLYQLGIGTIVMTISLIALVISYWLIKWIMDIKV